MRRLLPFLLALVLGASCAVLVACGDSGTDGGLPQADADQLSSDFEDVRQAVDSARCADVPDQLSQISRRLDNLPQDVDPRLVERLRDAQGRLASSLAPDECNANKRPDEPETTTQDTPTETETEPPPTATQAPPTETEAPDTETEPAPETTPTEPADPTVPDPGLPPLDDDTLPPDQGGGTSPEIP